MKPTRDKAPERLQGRKRREKRDSFRCCGQGLIASDLSESGRSLGSFPQATNCSPLPILQCHLGLESC
jgi:hypothetical protein